VRPGCLGYLSYSSQAFFSSFLRKILMDKGLRAPGMRRSGQNIEPQGLAGKILWNKGLELRAEHLPRSLAENELESFRASLQACAYQNSRSRLFVTRVGNFSVEGCGKVRVRSAKPQAHPNEQSSPTPQALHGAGGKWGTSRGVHQISNNRRELGHPAVTVRTR